VEKGAARRGWRARIELFQVDVKTDPREDVVETERVMERVMGVRRTRVIALAENIIGVWRMWLGGWVVGGWWLVVCKVGSWVRFMMGQSFSLGWKKNQFDKMSLSRPASLAWRRNNVTGRWMCPSGKTTETALWDFETVWIPGLPQDCQWRQMSCRLA
jgi:hypothetical protein